MIPRQMPTRSVAVLSLTAAMAFTVPIACAEGPIVWRSGRRVFPNIVSMSALLLEPVEDVMILDWGDIPRDTLVGSVAFEVCTFFPEGPVEGLTANLRVYDADNGNNTATRIPIGPPVSVPLEGSGDQFPLCRSQRLYTARFEPPIEIGDTDGRADAPGAVSNPFAYADLDGDARHDFSIGLDFDYPIELTDPRGQSVLLTGVPVARESGGNRLTDLFVGEYYAGTTDLFRNVYLLVRGPGCSDADHAPPFGVLDEKDIAAFIDVFVSSGAAADQAEPYFTLDLADLLAFAEAFVTGCP